MKRGVYEEADTYINNQWKDRDTYDSDKDDFDLPNNVPTMFGDNELAIALFGNENIDPTETNVAPAEVAMDV
jgi:hypothetical protein